MFNVRSLMHVLCTSSNIRKTSVLYNIRLLIREFNVRFEKNSFNA